MSLTQTIKDRFTEAVDSGALIFTDSTVSFVQDGAREVELRVAPSLAHKPTADAAPAKKPKVESFNPFLPYDDKLLVSADLQHHAVLLNKYAVCKYHILVVTKEFESQENPVNPVDFAAVWRCFEGAKDLEYLAFYNCGSCSGASQAHKHIQLIPMNDKKGRTFYPPVMKLIYKVNEPAGKIFRIPDYDFVHGCVLLDQEQLSPSNSEASIADYLSTVYGGLLGYMLDAMYTLRAQKYKSDGTWIRPGKKISYNLVFDRRFMLIVPRSAEKYAGEKSADDAAGASGEECAGISLNSLAYAGMMLLKEEGQAQTLARTEGLVSKIMRELSFENFEPEGEMQEQNVDVLAS